MNKELIKKAIELRIKGLTFNRIAKELQISKNEIIKAIQELKN